MNYTKPELVLLQQAKSGAFNQPYPNKRLFVTGAAILLVGVAAKIVGDLSLNNIVAGIFVVCNMFMIGEYVRFRNRALALIQKLQLGADSAPTSTSASSASLR